MLTYITEINAEKGFSKSHSFFNKYNWNIETKSKSLDSIFKYQKSINIRKTVDMRIERDFRINESLDYVSLNKEKTHKSKQLNRLKIRSIVMRKALMIQPFNANDSKTLVLKNSKKLSNKFLI